MTCPETTLQLALLTDEDLRQRLRAMLADGRESEAGEADADELAAVLSEFVARGSRT